MQLLGLPFYATAIFLGLTVSHLFPGAYLVVILLAPLVYSFVYSKAAYYFFRRMQPKRPAWQFVVSVLAVQVLVMAVSLYSVAA